MFSHFKVLLGFSNVAQNEGRMTVTILKKRGETKWNPEQDEDDKHTVPFHLRFFRTVFFQVVTKRH